LARSVTVALHALTGGAHSEDVEKNPLITTRRAKVCRSSPEAKNDVGRLHEIVPPTVATPVDGLTALLIETW
jgi:hypothetical protein